MAVNWKEIDRLAQAYYSVDPTSSEDALWRQLRLWWSIKYSRPFKDPLLDTYTLDELVFEYLTWFYMSPENDPAEKKRKEAQLQSDDDWAKKQLEKAQVQKSNDSKDSGKTSEPTVSIPNLPEISTNFDK